LAKAKTG